MSLHGMYENHYASEAQRAHRAAGARAVVPKERTVFDPEMGTAHLVGGPRRGGDVEGAWSCMVQMPQPEAPKVDRWDLDHELPKQPQLPAYDAQAEEVRHLKAARERDAWEQGASSMVPLGGEEPLGNLRPRSNIPSTGDAPFAIDGSNARDDDASMRPRGRQRQTAPLGFREDEDVKKNGRRSRRPAPESSRASTSSFNGMVANGSGDGLMCAAMGDGDAYAIGNPRAENFVLRTRSTKRVGITPQSQLDNSDAPSAEARRSNVRVFEGHGSGGGRSSVGFDEFGALSAALPSARPARRAVDRDGFEDRDVVKPQGRRHAAEYQPEDAADPNNFQQPQQQGRRHAAEPDDDPYYQQQQRHPSPYAQQQQQQRQPSPYAQQQPPFDQQQQRQPFPYAQQQQQQPPFDHQQQQQQRQPSPYAQQQQQQQQVRFDDHQRQPSPYTEQQEPAAPENDSSLDDFRAWYRSEYGEEPSVAALEHASKQLNQNHEPQQDASPTDTSKPATPQLSIDDEQAREFTAWYMKQYGEYPPPHLIARAAKSFAISGEAPNYEAPPPPPSVAAPVNDNRRSRGPRPGAIGSESTANNSIIGRSSSRVSRPPGGGSSIDLSWN